MSSAYFPSLADCEIVEVDFQSKDGGWHVQKLLVDSGFTGQSGLLLADECDEFLQAPVAACQTLGALQGKHPRGLVNCRIASLRFEAHLVAIFADIEQLSLPADVTGMVGLKFLRHFSRWGAQVGSDGKWTFFLETETG